MPVGSVVRKRAFTDRVTRVRDDLVVRVTIPPGVTKIEYTAFEGWASLESVDFPEGLKSIEVGAFRDCKSLTSVTFPSTLLALGTSAFEDCTSLFSVKFNDAPPDDEALDLDDDEGRDLDDDEGLIVHTRVFWGCSLLSDIVFPSNLYWVQTYAFAYCESLTTIKFPNACEMIDKDALADCPSLTEVWVPANLEKIDHFSHDEPVDLFTVEDLLSGSIPPDPDPDYPEPEWGPEFPNLLFVFETSDGGPTMVHVTPRGRRLVQKLLSRVSATRQLVLSPVPPTDNITLQIDRVPRLLTELPFERGTREDRLRGPGWDALRGGSSFYLNVFARHKLPYVIKMILLSMLDKEDIRRVGALYDWTTSAAGPGSQRLQIGPRASME